MSAQDGRTRLIRGEGRYTGDLMEDGALHAVFLRSDRAHAHILSVDLEAAREIEGVVEVFTAETLGPFGSFPSVLRYPGRGGAAFKAPGRPPIAGDVVRHVGEIVAVAVARSARAAQDAAEAIFAEMEDLPAVIGLDDALSDESSPIHPEFPGNVAFDVDMGDAAATTSRLAQSTHVVELTVTLPRLAPTPMEPRAALGRYDAGSGRFTLLAPHQGAPEVRRDLAAVLQVPEDRIDVVAENVGGAFGARGPAYPEQALLLRIAEKLGQPVRWQGTRIESFMTDHHGRGTRLTGRLGLDEHGRFTALEVTYEADLGAYVSPVGAHINVHNPLQTLTGAYRIPVAAATFRLAYTNAVPIGPYRGAGRPDIAFLIERLVDESARRLGFDRVALRRQNLVPRSAFPYRSAVGVTYDSGDYRRLLDEATTAIDWRGRAARTRAARRAGLLHGVGLSLFVEVAGGGPVPHDEVRMRIEPGEGRAVLVLETLAQSTGQSHAEVFSSLIASELGIAPDRILWRPVPQGLAGAGAFASRATSAVGSAVLEACRRMREVCVDVAAVLDDPARAAQVPPVTASAPNSVTFPSGCHAAEVTIDPQTGVVTLERYVAVDDAGRVLSEAAVHGQIHGGIAQGLGGALLEAAVYDPDGQLVTSTLMDYALPRASDLVPITTALVSVPSPNNPLGVKGVGEAGTTGALGAVANAVMDALAKAGAGPVDIPLTPDKVWHALQSRG